MTFLVQGGAPPSNSVSAGTIQSNAVTTAKINNDAVTGAKLNPSLVAGDIIYANGTDTIARLAKGSDGEVLTLASGIPSWAAGGLVSISNTSITAVTNRDVTGFVSGTYDNYEIWISNGQPGTDSARLEMETSTDGGSSFDTGASDYTWAGSANTEAGAVNDGADPDDSEIQLMSTQAVGNAANENLSAKISIFMPETTEYTAFTWSTVSRQNDASLQTSTGGGERQSAADVDGIRLHWSSGDWVAQGKIQFLGIKN